MRLPRVGRQVSRSTTDLSPQGNGEVVRHEPACTHRSRLDADRWLMSALPPKADKARTCRDVRFVPLPAVSSCSNIRVRKLDLLDHLVGDAEQRRGDGQSQTTWGICKPPVNATIAMVGTPARHAAPARLELSTLEDIEVTLQRSSFLPTRKPRSTNRPSSGRFQRWAERRSCAPRK